MLPSLVVHLYSTTSNLLLHASSSSTAHFFESTSLKPCLSPSKNTVLTSPLYPSWSSPYPQLDLVAPLCRPFLEVKARHLLLCQHRKQRSSLPDLVFLFFCQRVVIEYQCVEAMALKLTGLLMAYLHVSLLFNVGEQLKLSAFCCFKGTYPIFAHSSL